LATGSLASLARPGGNITGLSSLAAELSGKRLELLKEVVPRLSRVAIFGNTAAQSYAESLKETQLAASVLKLELHYLDVLGLKDIEPAFRAAQARGGLKHSSCY
jgi:putative tryptophan/tyrosine transport system substrate-binding protein